MNGKTMKKGFILILITMIFFPLCSESLDVPEGYRGVRIGMNMDDVKEVLKNDDLFNYRGERDVSLLPSEHQSIIETSSDTWLQRCWFQFYENTLYSIIINFNPELMDYNSVYRQLTEKYGMHTEMSPERVVWKDSYITMSLEKPVSVKYLYNDYFERITGESTVKETKMEETRDSILGDL